MGRVVLERLSVPNVNRSGLRHWPVSVEGAAEAARGGLWGKGICAPPMWMAGAVVVPVVEWDSVALRTRLAGRGGAILDRVLLRDRYVEGRLEDEPAVLSILGSLIVSPLTQAGDAAARLSAYGPVAICVPEPPGVEAWQAMECDYFGNTVVAVDAQLHARVVVQGRSGARPGSRPFPHQQRMRQEQVFDVAQRARRLPAV